MPENRIAMYGRKACSAYGWFGKPFRLANYIMPKTILEGCSASCALLLIELKPRIESVVKCVRMGAFPSGSAGISVAEVLRPVPSLK